MTEKYNKTVITSAPGKVIVFGEHAVVYGKVNNKIIIIIINIK